MQLTFLIMDTLHTLKYLKTKKHLKDKEKQLTSFTLEGW